MYTQQKIIKNAVIQARLTTYINIFAKALHGEDKLKRNTPYTFDNIFIDSNELTKQSIDRYNKTLSIQNEPCINFPSGEYINPIHFTGLQGTSQFLGKLGFRLAEINGNKHIFVNNIQNKLVTGSLKASLTQYQDLRTQEVAFSSNTEDLTDNSILIIPYYDKNSLELISNMLLQDRTQYLSNQHQDKRTKKILVKIDSENTTDELQSPEIDIIKKLTFSIGLQYFTRVSEDVSDSINIFNTIMLSLSGLSYYERDLLMSVVSPQN